MARAMAVSAALAVVLLAGSSQAFYLPGVAPQDYARDDIVNFKASPMSEVSHWQRSPAQSRSNNRERVPVSVP